MRGKALIIGYKDLARTPRILKEVHWLSETGWSVDCVGFGDLGSDASKQFPLRYNSVLKRLFAYLIRDPKKRFVFQYQESLESCLPELGNYELIIIHEPTFLPSSVLRAEITRRQGTGIIIDLHEDHLNSLSRNQLEKIVFEKYRRWERQQMLDLLMSLPFITVTTVSPRIAARYSEAIGTSVRIVRNAPAHIPDLNWSGEKSKVIKLVHHGVGTTHRGIELAIGALKSLEGRFELNLMLVSTKLYLLKLRLLAFINGVSQHVKFHPPVATRDIPREISKYDLALVIIEPVTENELDAFPNKFFESIQGRLGVIIGPSPELLPIVESTGIGASMRSWTTSSLVELLKTIGPEEVSRFREASAKVALEFSSEQDRFVFLDAVKRSTGE